MILFLSVILSTLFWQVLASALLVRLLEPSFTPNLGLLWVIILADRTPSTPAREGDFWISGLFLSVFIGYMLDLFYVAPRGLYMCVYGACFLVLRVLTHKLAQGSPVRLGLTIAAVSFAVDVVVWWIKGFSTSFATVVSFSPLGFASVALVNAAIGMLIVPQLAAPFDERREGFR